MATLILLQFSAGAGILEWGRKRLYLSGLTVPREKEVLYPTEAIRDLATLPRKANIQPGPAESA